MKLKNKKTGEIIDLDIANIKAQFGGISVIPEPAVLSSPEYVYTSLAELNAEWEDYKKPNLVPDQIFLKGSRVCIDYKSVEAAEKAVKKLEAWKRLRKKFDFHITGWGVYDTEVTITTDFTEEYVRNRQDNGIWDDLDICFGGEEWVKT